jgi:PadR family transcriptional regulator, regulatory protein PadR
MYCIVLKKDLALYHNFKKACMDIQNTQSQMRKGVLEFCILSIIRQGEVYPSDIVDKMKGANLHILEGTLYPLLTRLKNAGYLTYRWVESNSGPPRKYFLMTDSGLQFYSELERTWKELADAVQTLTSTDGSITLADENFPNNNQIN